MNALLVAAKVEEEEVEVLVVESVLTSDTLNSTRPADRAWRPLRQSRGRNPQLHATSMLFPFDRGAPLHAAMHINMT